MSTNSDEPGPTVDEGKAVEFLDKAAEAAKRISPKYTGELNVTETLIPVVVHGGLALVHWLHHLVHHTKSTPAGSK